MSLDKYNGGGAVIGAIAGMSVAGPIGAIIGGLGGYFIGEQIEDHSYTNLTLLADEQTITAKKGKTIKVLPFGTGHLATITPPSAAAGTASVNSSGTAGYIIALTSGIFTAGWRDAANAPHQTHISVVVI